MFEKKEEEEDKITGTDAIRNINDSMSRIEQIDEVFDSFIRYHAACALDSVNRIDSELKGETWVIRRPSRSLNRWCDLCKVEHLLDDVCPEWDV